MELAQPVRHAAANEYVTRAASGVFHLRTGPRPASTGDANAGTLIGEITLPVAPLDGPSGDTMYSAAVAGLPWADVAVADGTVGHWRLFESDGTTVLSQGTVSLVGGGGEAQMVALDYLTGHPMAVVAFSANWPG